MSIFGGDYKGRKNLPIFDMMTGYFPKALREVTRVCVGGNVQHNPGEPLHWSRGKSTDQLNTAVRHLIDHKLGEVFDESDTPEILAAVNAVGDLEDERLYHLAKAAWRVLAALELTIEEQEKLSKARREERLLRMEIDKLRGYPSV